jgi:hypothetical protein
MVTTGVLKVRGYGVYSALVLEKIIAKSIENFWLRYPNPQLTLLMLLSAL